MTIRTQCLICAAGLLVCTGTYAVRNLSNRPVAEPQYNEVPLSRWLYLLGYGAPGEAGAAIREIGPEAIPFLIRALRDNRTSPGEQAYEFIRLRVPNAVQVHLPRADLRDPDLPNRVAVALSHIGDRALPQLLDALNDSNPEIQSSAATAIRMIDPNHPALD